MDKIQVVQLKTSSRILDFDVHCIHILQAVMSVIVCYNSRALYKYTTSRHVCDCLLQQSYTVYIYYKSSCLWLFVTTVVHCIHILQAVMSVIVCYNSRILYLPRAATSTYQNERCGFIPPLPQLDEVHILTKILYTCCLCMKWTPRLVNAKGVVDLMQ